MITGLLGIRSKILNDIFYKLQFTVVNLMKSIYAMREHRATLVEESLDNSIEMVIRLLEVYISGKGKLL